VNDLPGENPAEGGDDDEIRREPPEGIEKERFPDLLRLKEWKVQVFGEDLDGGRRRCPATPLRPVGLRHDADDGIAAPYQTLERRNGESGCSHEEDARF
jgi:hypothetical protein